MAQNDFFDFNGVEPPASLIPAGSFLALEMAFRKKDGSYLVPSKSSNAEMLDVEFEVISKTMKGRKFWQFMVVSGGKQDEAGQSIAGNISRALLRTILESAKGINPNDTSPGAVKARQVAGFHELDGLKFVGEVGVQPEKDGYKAKNFLKSAVTPDRKEYAMVRQGPGIIATKATAAPVQSAAPVQTKSPVPDWANNPVPPLADSGRPGYTHRFPFVVADSSVPDWADNPTTADIKNNDIPF